MQSQKMLVKLKKASSESQKGNYLKSISLCKKILDKDRQNVATLKLLATSLIKLNRFSEAGIALKKVIKLVSDEESYPLLHLLGCNFISLNRPNDALEVLENLFNKTGDSKILLDIALSYFNLGNYEAARDIYFKLIELEPNNHQAKFNLYPILLYFKDFKNAWVCFHSRLERQEIKKQIHWFAPQWNGESLTGKNIIIYPEQGIGDNLSYTGCFDEAITDAKKTYIVCDNRLKGLYQHNFPLAKVLSYDDVNREQAINGNIDLQILAGSLCYLYRPSGASFNRQIHLTIAEPLRKSISKRFTNNKLRIGLSWFHGRVNDGNRFSMYLEELLPLLKMPGIEWVNLQFGEYHREVENMQAKHGISITNFDDCAASGDFEYYGALISNLDLVISASNAALMLTSRLGIKSWMFSPNPIKSKTPSDFQNNIWIKNSRRFSKGTDKDWSGVVQQFCDEIKLFKCR